MSFQIERAQQNGLKWVYNQGEHLEILEHWGRLDYLKALRRKISLQKMASDISIATLEDRKKSNNVTEISKKVISMLGQTININHEGRINLFKKKPQKVYYYIYSTHIQYSILCACL